MRRLVLMTANRLHCVSLGHPGAPGDPGALGHPGALGQRGLCAPRRALGSALFVMSTFLGFSGCGTQSERRPIAGTVSIDRKPIQRGSISFFPDRGHSGPAASTAITAGTYRFTETNGPVAGSHRVVIGVETNPQGVKDEAAGLPASSAMAKGAPGKAAAPAAANGGSGELDLLSQTQWTATVDIPSASSPKADDAIDFAFQSEADRSPPTAKEAP